jgi:hypothetical protein
MAKLHSEKVIKFLIEAKKATYAGKGPEKLPSRPNSHDLEYEKENLKYIDTYLGGEKFAGEEALWENNKPFWAMNYIGRILSDGFNGDFLKEALLNVPIDMPYRGPREYKNNNYTYKCTVEGDFDWFRGYEEIFNGNIKVYECMFHGGIIN